MLLHPIAYVPGRVPFRNHPCDTLPWQLDWILLESLFRIVSELLKALSVDERCFSCSIPGHRNFEDMEQRYLGIEPLRHCFHFRGQVATAIREINREKNMFEVHDLA